MGFIRLIIIFLSIYMLLGCKTLATESPIAAVIPEHTNESLSELKSLVREALNGIPVTISNSAFTKSNRLLIERKQSIGPDGRIIQSKIDQKPIIFELFIKNKSCYLKSLSNLKVVQITQARCIEKAKVISKPYSSDY